MTIITKVFIQSPYIFCGTRLRSWLGVWRWLVLFWYYGNIMLNSFTLDRPAQKVTCITHDIRVISLGLKKSNLIQWDSGCVCVSCCVFAQRIFYESVYIHVYGCQWSPWKVLLIFLIFQFWAIWRPFLGQNVPQIPIPAEMSDMHCLHSTFKNILDICSWKYFL